MRSFVLPAEDCLNLPLTNFDARVLTRLANLIVKECDTHWRGNMWRATCLQTTSSTKIIVEDRLVIWEITKHGISVCLAMAGDTNHKMTMHFRVANIAPDGAYVYFMDDKVCHAFFVAAHWNSMHHCEKHVHHSQSEYRGHPYARL